MIYSTLETRHPASRVSLSLSLHLSPSFSLSLSSPFLRPLYLSSSRVSLSEAISLFFFSSSSSVRYDSNVNQLPTYLEKHDGRREKERDSAERERESEKRANDSERGGREKSWNEAEYAHTNASMPLTHQPHPVFRPSGLSVTFVETSLASFRSFITR